jgi:transcriptional regulator with XRE-family HTH domain
MKDARVESQAQLARLSGVPQPTINRILKGGGKKGPESATLVALANATSVEFLWLQQGRGPQKAVSPTEGGGEARDDDKARLRVVEPSTKTTLQWVTDREAELLSEFRACEEPQKKTLLAAARGLPKAVTVAARDKA